MVGGPETILLYAALILFASKIGSEAATRLKQPAVVGEILMGVFLGPSLLGIIPSFEILDHAKALVAAGPAAFDARGLSDVQDLSILALLAQLGVLLLLFEVGLESNLKEFTRVGASAGLVGTYGVAFSLAVGFGASYLFSRQFDWVITDTAIAQPHLLHLFIGATLTATSVGITARVLGELGRIRTQEGQIILGAAVIDDVLGLVVLGIVSGLVLDPAAVSYFGAAKVFVFAFGFFFLAIALGVLLAPRLIDVVHHAFRSPFIHLGFALIVMLSVSFLATWVGLAAIIGAFAAGLSLSTSGHRHVIFEHVKPVGSVFIGFFFVILGTRVDLGALTPSTLPTVVVLGGILTVVGILAKLAAGWGVIRSKASRYVVGIGMVPRGEVGLIFALFGLEHGLINNWQYTTILLVVLFTTLITPFWLKSVTGRFGAPLPEPPGQARLGEAMHR